MKEPGPIFALNLTPTSRFKSRLVNYIRVFVRDKVPKCGPDQPIRQVTSEGRIAALNALADYIASVPAEDPRLFQLAQVARSLPGVEAWRQGEQFEPTVTQSKMLYALGSRGPTNAIAPEDTFSELVSAGIADMAALHRAGYAEAEENRKAAVKRAEEAEAKVAPLAQAEADLAAERAKAERLQGHVDRLQTQVADLEGFIGGEGGSKPRRVHVGGGAENVGIYRAVVDGAPVLEVGYPDSEGKQRWKRLAPDASIEQARRLRARLAGQPHDPEHGGHTDEEADEASQGAGTGDDDQQTTTEPVAAGRE